MLLGVWERKGELEHSVDGIEHRTLGEAAVGGYRSG